MPAPAALPEPPSLPSEPAPAPAPRPSPAGDPSLGPVPDAVPDIELPPTRRTDPAPSPVPAPAIPGDEPQPPAIPDRLPSAPDPSLGRVPDAVPDIELPPTRPAPAPSTAPGPIPDPTAMPPGLPIPADEPPGLPIPAPSPAPRPTRPGGDPSLGRVPDAVPDIEPPPSRPSPASEPDPPPSAEPSPIPDLPPDAAIPAPAEVEVPALPESEAAPAEIPALPAAEPPDAGIPTLPPADMPPTLPVEVPTIPPDYSPPTARVPAADPEVRMASSTPAPTANDTMPPGAEWKVGPGKAASETAARVGDEIITLSELRTAVREQLRGMNLPKDQQPSPADLNAVASLMLDRMIDRVILVQEAKRKIKDEKKWKQFMDVLEREWRTKELPELIRQNGVPDEYALKKKLEGEKLSLQDKHAAYVQNLLAREFLMGQVKDRIRVYAPAMKEYYEAHRNDFDRPAMVRWREVAVEVGKHADRAEARRKAEAALARIRRGEPFAKVAQALSEGPTADKGGLWETSPDGYNVPAVREALASLPPNQASGLLEGPESYHIILVESRRAAGPARFDEVQDEIRKILIEEKESNEMNAYLDGVRGRYAVITMFDGSDSAPGAGRKAMESATGRRGR
ncbi:MAG: peptidyl-prolyl cis-trans isomerase [Isosphaeraceae bacterium]